MSITERKINPAHSNESVTTITANARIDYILRFTKQAVLVIDDNADVYTDIGNQFLGDLPNENNAAFVSSSSQLNDIQIRCRIIEQLFGNTLFDPEQPLSVNIIKLSQVKNEAITIVISQAETLSTQLSHELCQLAELAKKLKKTINILLLGNTQAANKLSQNKHLFDNKISVVLASNGQLISLHSSYLKHKNNTSNIARNLTMFALMLIPLIILLSYLYSAGYFTSLFTESPAKNNTVNVKDSYKKEFVNLTSLPQSETTAKQDKKLNITQGLTQNKNQSKLKEIASPNDVYSVLMVSEKTPSIAKSQTNINALSVKNNSKKAAKSERLPATSAVNSKVLAQGNNPESTKALKAVSSPVSRKISLNPDYYQGLKKGYIIQLASFINKDIFTEFTKAYNRSSFYGYTRSAKGTVSYILTSKAYNTRKEANNAIKLLPAKLQARAPWVKSVKAVNNEINLYQQTR